MYPTQQLWLQYPINHENRKATSTAMSLEGAVNLNPFSCGHNRMLPYIQIVSHVTESSLLSESTM